MASSPSSQENAEIRRLRFLLEEGLELLATFQLISDAATRRKIMDDIKKAAMREGAHPAHIAEERLENAIAPPRMLPAEISN